MTDVKPGFDFDVHANALREAGAEIIFTARSHSPWHVRRYRVKRFTLELCSEGGASIVAGTLAPDSVVFAVIAAGQTHGAVLNGQTVGPLDLVVIPPALRFIKTSLGPHAWILVSVSRADVAGIDELSDFAPLLREQRPIVIRSVTLSQKVIQAAGAVEREFAQNGSAQARQGIDGLEGSLIDLVSAVGEVALLRINAMHGRQRHRSSRLDELAHDAVGLIGGVDLQHLRVSDFCRVLGASERELRRSFKSYFAMGPTRLSRLHKVNRVRRILVGGVNPDVKIMDLLAAADISEPGRFAGQYKALFGEPPSVTRRRHLAAAARPSPG